MRDGVRRLLTLLLYELLRREDRLVVLLLLHAEAALSVRPHLAPRLRHSGAHVLPLLLALLHEDCVAVLRLVLPPHHGLVGGHVHTELLVVVQVDRGRRGGGGGVVHRGSVPGQLGGFSLVSPRQGRHGGGQQEGGEGQEGPHAGQEAGH